MAEYFASDGWKDITIAFPVNTLEIERINMLAEQVKLNLLVENEASVAKLKAGLTQQVHMADQDRCWISSYRVGPNGPGTDRYHLRLINASSKMHFAGFLGHAGHSYKSRSSTAIQQVHQESLAAIRPLKDHYLHEFPDLIISVGDTPTCSWADDFEGADEIRPGNFVFYDLAQWRIGSCRLEQIAVAMACPGCRQTPRPFGDRHLRRRCPFCQGPVRADGWQNAPLWPRSTIDSKRLGLSRRTELRLLFVTGTWHPDRST